MHIRPYEPHDSLALATIKAHCDVSDPLALYCRRSRLAVNSDNDKQWRAHVKYFRRSLELELLLPGTVGWVIVLDEDEDEDGANSSGTGMNRTEKIVGFAVWNRCGSSPAARKWQSEGNQLSRRIKAFLAYIRMIITYPFDSSIDHSHKAKFQQRVRSSGPSSSQHHQHQAATKPAKERWELEALYIHPRYQRRGYGLSALQRGIEMARKENVDIWVWSTLAGKKAYVKAGFAVVARIGFEDLINVSDDDDAVEQEQVKEGMAIWVMVWRSS